MRAGSLKRAALAGLALTMGLAACSSSPSQAVTRPFYGVVADSSFPLTPTDYKRMGKAKVGTLRFEFFWPGLQTAQGGLFNWTATDAMVEGAARNGVQILPVLYGTADFETGCSSRECRLRLPIRNPAERADWKAFVAAAAQRYGPTGDFWTEDSTVPYLPIHNWQIWNEQNNFNSQDQPRSTPAEYAKLVRITHSALTSVDPGAQATLGGMFGTPNASQSRAITSWSFLNGLYKHGLKPDFDAVAIHPYSPTISGFRYQIKRLRKVMARHHDAATPIDVTEIGWGSDSRHVNHPLVKSVARQKQLLTEAFSLVTRNRQRWNIGGVDWFSWRDPKLGEGLCAFCYSSGLYRHGGKPKRSLGAYEKFTGGG